MSPENINVDKVGEIWKVTCKNTGELLKVSKEKPKDEELFFLNYSKKQRVIKRSSAIKNMMMKVK